MSAMGSVLNRNEPSIILVSFDSTNRAYKIYVYISSIYALIFEFKGTNSIKGGDLHYFVQRVEIYLCAKYQLGFSKRLETVR